MRGRWTGALGGTIAGGVIGALLSTLVGVFAFRAGQHPAAASLRRSQPSAEELAAMKVEHEAQRRQHAARFERESRNSDLATVALEPLRRSLQAAAPAGHYQVVSIDCKETMCASTLRWNCYADARSGYRVVMQSNRPPGCGVLIDIPEPADPAQPYETTVYFDCTVEPSSRGH